MTDRIHDLTTDAATIGLVNGTVLAFVRLVDAYDGVMRLFQLLLVIATFIWTCIRIAKAYEDYRSICRRERGDAPADRVSRQPDPEEG